jgi:LmbE family N-acetylglucosaminyl deacetylase
VQGLFESATAPEADQRPAPKSVLVFAHPDDEVVALGARLGRFASAHFVHVTDGAPRNENDSRAHGFQSLSDYRNARASELRRALTLAGVPPAAQENLDLPDQEASLRLYQLINRLYPIFKKHRPQVVFTHPYEGGHPDHDACAFAVHRAVSLLKAREGLEPLIVEGAFYHAAVDGLEPGAFLPHPQQTQEVVFQLQPAERSRKQQLVRCFTSQQETLRNLIADCERFRIAPKYNFQIPPHAPPVLYDNYPWGMTSQRFCELVNEADQMLAAETSNV